MKISPTLVSIFNRSFPSFFTYMFIIWVGVNKWWTTIFDSRILRRSICELLPLTTESAVSFVFLQPALRAWNRSDRFRMLRDWLFSQRLVNIVLLDEFPCLDLTLRWRLTFCCTIPLVLCAHSGQKYHCSIQRKKLFLRMSNVLNKQHYSSDLWPLKVKLNCIVDIWQIAQIKLIKNAVTLQLESLVSSFSAVYQ
jgi:hypothetical protein